MQSVRVRAVAVALLTLLVVMDVAEANVYKAIQRCFLCEVLALRLGEQARRMCQDNQARSERWTVHQLYELCTANLLHELNQDCIDVGWPARFNTSFCLSMFSNYTKLILETTPVCADSASQPQGIDMTCKLHCIIENQAGGGNERQGIFICKDHCKDAHADESVASQIGFLNSVGSGDNADMSDPTQLHSDATEEEMEFNANPEGHHVEEEDELGGGGGGGSEDNDGQSLWSLFDFWWPWDEEEEEPVEEQSDTGDDPSKHLGEVTGDDGSVTPAGDTETDWSVWDYWDVLWFA